MDSRGALSSLSRKRENKNKEDYHERFKKIID